MSISLGDYFGRDHKLKRGNVYKIKLTDEDGITCQHGYSHRNKFVIIIGHDNNNCAVGVILINSKINRINFQKELYVLHYPLTATKYGDFLDHNSHADCTDLIALDEHRFDTADYKGILEPDDLELITATIKASTTITPKLKKRFGLF